jgi:hypothetical protein
MVKTLRRLLVTLVLLPVFVAWVVPSFASTLRTGASVCSRTPGPNQAGEPDGGQTNPDPPKNQVGPGPTPPADQPVRWTRWVRIWTSSLRSAWLIRW